VTPWALSPRMGGPPAWASCSPGWRPRLSVRAALRLCDRQATHGAQRGGPVCQATHGAQRGGPVCQVTHGGRVSTYGSLHRAGGQDRDEAAKTASKTDGRRRTRLVAKTLFMTTKRTLLP
jgi:hypothetical protein